MGIHDHDSDRVDDDVGHDLGDLQRPDAYRRADGDGRRPATSATADRHRHPVRHRPRWGDGLVESDRAQGDDGEQRVSSIRGRNLDHAECLERPRRHLVGRLFERGSKKKSCTFTMNGAAAVTANVQ